MSNFRIMSKQTSYNNYYYFSYFESRLHSGKFLFGRFRCFEKQIELLLLLLFLFWLLLLLFRCFECDNDEWLFALLRRSRMLFNTINLVFFFSNIFKIFEKRIFILLLRFAFQTKSPYCCNDLFRHYRKIKRFLLYLTIQHQMMHAIFVYCIVIIYD